MPVKDNSLVAQYIRALENPDSLGYDNGIWRDPGNPGVFDSRNRGFGVDVENNNAAIALTKNRRGKWLTEEEERNLRLSHIEDNQSTLDKWTPKMLKEFPSEEKKAMALGMLYRGDGITSILKNPAIRDAYFSGTTEDMQKAIADTYNKSGKKYLVKRAEDSKKFFKSGAPTPKSRISPYIKKQEHSLPKYSYEPQAYISKSKLFSDGGTLDNSWNNLSQKEKSEMMKVAIQNGITTLPEIREAYNKFVNPTVDENGNTYTSTWKANEYGDGGYKPSESIKKRISTWEGSSMKTNRSFAAEASDFNRVVPASVRAKLSSNQLDALYSYGYNVGMGNLKQRVVPVLTAYTQGKASKEDVQRAMWASRDNELRGLTTRRNAEREMFGGNYRTAFTGTGKLGVHINPSEYTAYEDLSPMIDNINIPQLELPDAMKTDPTKAFTPPVIDTTLFANPKVQEESAAVYNPMQERKDNIQTFNTVMGLLGGSSPLTGLPTDSSGLLSYIGQIYS